VFLTHPGSEADLAPGARGLAESRAALAGSRADAQLSLGAQGARMAHQL
jgi:hypothetical protein